MRRLASGTEPLLLATRSEGKLRELMPLFIASGWEVQTLADVGYRESDVEDALEQFDSFEANAMAKARYFAEQHPGRLVIADDSGLVVDALGGRPGVMSKRWSGAQTGDVDAANNALLLTELERVGAHASYQRTARYVCAMASARLHAPSDEHVVRGETEGLVLPAAIGTEGFGYDPLFWSTELRQGFGEVSRDAKARVSHRARALRALLAHLVRAG